MAQKGWGVCSGPACSRADGLNAGSTFPPITVTANVAANAPSSVVNTVNVSGGGSPNISATDTATVVAVSGRAVPIVVSVAPTAGIGNSQSYTIQFAHPSGYKNLSVVDVLINTALDGRQGCYSAYSLRTNTIYLVDDGGDAGGPFAGSLLLNSSNGIANDQCTIIGAGTSAVGSGTTLTLTVTMAFARSFGGNKVVFAAAGDISQHNSGWQTMGVVAISPLPSTFPMPVSVSPSSGTGSNPTFVLTYNDVSMGVNLQTAWALINNVLDGRHACYVAYYRPGNQVFLVPDNGDGTQAAGMVLGGSTNTIGNSQCTVSTAGSYATVTNAQLVVGLNITFNSPAFTGTKAIFMAVQALDGTVSQWQALSAWRVP